MLRFKANKCREKQGVRTDVLTKNYNCPDQTTWACPASGDLSLGFAVDWKLFVIPHVLKNRLAKALHRYLSSQPKEFFKLS